MGAGGSLLPYSFCPTGEPTYLVMSPRRGSTPRLTVGRNGTLTLTFGEPKNYVTSKECHFHTYVHQTLFRYLLRFIPSERTFLQGLRGTNARTHVCVAFPYYLNFISSQDAPSHQVT
jgi:hypothetical protein